VKMPVWLHRSTSWWRVLIGVLVVLGVLSLPPGQAPAPVAGSSTAAVRALIGCPPITRLPATRDGASFSQYAPTLAGGCAFEARGKMDIRLLTAVSDLPVSSCLVLFTMRIDGRGEVGVDELEAQGPTPCNDIRPCLRPNGFPPPMRGRLLTADDGGARLELDMCLDTCLGRFAAPFETSVEPAARGHWKLVPDDRRVTLGDSGWRFEGDGWELRSSREIDLQSDGG
jgi:hypothetical protein